jgi:hypothetical protein
MNSKRTKEKDPLRHDVKNVVATFITKHATKQSVYAVLKTDH